jgi:CcmD family protein
MTSLYNFLNTHSLYVVLLIVVVIWLGIFLYLLWLDKKVNELYGKSESELSQNESFGESSKQGHEKEKIN